MSKGYGKSSDLPWVKGICFHETVARLCLVASKADMFGAHSAHGAQAYNRGGESDRSRAAGDMLATGKLLLDSRC